MGFLTKKKIDINKREMEVHKDLRDSFHWESSNGARKLLKDLDHNHLKNIIAKIERGELDNSLTSLSLLKTELKYRYLENGGK